MELELKHLAPYLPYGLKVAINVFKEDYENYEEMKLTSDYNSCNSVNDVISGVTLHGCLIKPILRPLSDLGKEIEFNGITDKIPLLDKSVNLAKQGLSELLPYNVFQTLLKFHFDVFGLIEKGLAIDINTLNQ